MVRGPFADRLLRVAFPAVTSGGLGARLFLEDVSLLLLLPYCGRRKKACSFLSSNGAVFSVYGDPPPDQMVGVKRKHTKS